MEYKSPVTLLFADVFVYAYTKENIESPRYSL